MRAVNAVVPAAASARSSASAASAVLRRRRWTSARWARATGFDGERPRTSLQSDHRLVQLPVTLELEGLF